MTGSQRVWILNGLLVALAVTLFPTLTALPSPDAPFRIPWWALAALFFLAEVHVVHFHFRRDAYSFSLSEIPLVLGLIFAAPLQMLLAQLAGVALALRFQRKQSLLKLIFNVSHQFVGAGLAVAIFQGVAAPGEVGPSVWVAAFAATTFAAVLADVLIGLAISFSEGKLEFGTSLRMLGMAVVGTVANTSLALVGAVVMWRDPAASVLLLVPAGALILAYRAYTEQRQKRESLEFLYEAMRSLDECRELELAMVALLSNTRKTFRAELAEITLFPSADSEASLRTLVGPDRRVEVMEPVELAPAEAAWSRLSLDDKALLFARPIQDSRIARHFVSRGIRDAMVAQIHGETRIVGYMLVGNRLGEVSTFDDQDLQLFETLASHISVALENGRLEKSLAQITELEKERTVLLEKAVQAAEDERTRLAGELHDGPVQRLSALDYQLDRVRLRLRRGEFDSIDELLTSFKRDLAEEIWGLRRLMTELRPPILDERGLEAALDDYLKQFRVRTGVRCVMRSELPCRLDPTRETILYRLAQEALTNVGKHARARSVWLNLQAENGSVVVNVVDDGVGFDPGNMNGLTVREHFGLAFMRERIEMAGGTWELHSQPGGGTAIRATLPRNDGAT
jgi:signal transduction histidine kinase